MKLRGLLTSVYGAWLMCGGVLRFVQAGSNAALGFGLVMGALALVGGLCFFRNRRMLGTLITGLAVLFVLGFYLSKVAKEGADLRVTITLVASVAEIVVLAWPTRSTR